MGQLSIRFFFPWNSPKGTSSLLGLRENPLARYSHCQFGDKMSKIMENHGNLLAYWIYWPVCLLLFSGVSYWHLKVNCSYQQTIPESTNTFPDTNIAPEKWCLEVRRLFSFGDVIVSGSIWISEMVSCFFFDREGYFAKFSPSVCVCVGDSPGNTFDSVRSLELL